MNSGENSADGIDIAGTDWDRLLGEPSLWYSRFTIYRLLGPARTLEAAHKAAQGCRRSGKVAGIEPGQAWTRNSSGLALACPLRGLGRRGARSPV